MTPEDLVELEAIKQLKYRYVRLIDLKEWDELETLFVPDATATYSDGKYSFEGRDAIMTFLREAMASTNMLTSHKVHQPEIDLDGDRATAKWALDDVVIHLDYNMRISGAAFYRDEYVKQDGLWRIKHTGYERVFEEMQPRPDDVKLTARKWDSNS
ncbi:MAG: nuclear transport factor 2 family protein [Vicinamibacterales bacterium]